MTTAEPTPPMPETPRCPKCGAPLGAGALAGLCPACLLQQGAAADSVTGAGPRAFEPPTIAELAPLFPQLEIFELIGQGGMGAVYKARQKELDRVVALKILPPAMGDTPGFAERFSREAKALAKLNHPAIVTIHEFGRANGLFYFLMEFVDGVNLRQLLANGRISPREALAIVPEICDALQFAHDHGIVHRDIKPANILLDRRGRVKVADFGLAKLVEAGTEAAPVEPGSSAEAALTQAGKVMGTPSYMAPEQSDRPGEVDHRADIYSLGVVLYELLTGELPTSQLQPPSRRVRVDVRLDEVVLRALEKEPALRYQQASQVKSAVETIADTASPQSETNSDVAAEGIVTRDYSLRIGSCLRRGWQLVRSDFWPLVGITALVAVLLSALGSAGTTIDNSTNNRHSSPAAGILYLLLEGPLVGGLQLYFLHKIRGRQATVETAFSGFSPRFLHLFLAGFVTTTLTALGFFCLIVPGIYLMIAWTFTLALVIDKQLHFWSAMELSRKVVSKHWWKFFGFAIVLTLLKLVGLLAFIVGFFIALPIAIAALMFAYEDVFCAGGADGLAPNAGVPQSADVTPAGIQKSALKKWIWVIAGIVLFSGLMIWLATPTPRSRPRTQAPKTLRAVPSPTSWLKGEWAFDADYFKQHARAAANAATDPTKKATLNALSEAVFAGSEGMTWTITDTEMQSNHPQSGIRKGPYRVVQTLDADTAIIEVIDEDKPKQMIFHREGQRLRLLALDQQGSLEIPAYYKRVTRSSSKR
jgi:serine/threonine protein kinase